MNTRDTIDGKRWCFLCIGPHNPKPGDEVAIYELGEPEPRWVPGWVAKRNERSGRIAAGVRIEG